MKHPLNFWSTVTFGPCDIPTPFSVPEIYLRPCLSMDMPTLFYQEYDISSIYLWSILGSQVNLKVPFMTFGCNVTFHPVMTEHPFPPKKRWHSDPLIHLVPLWQCSRKPLTNFSAEECRTTNNTWLAHSWGAKAFPRTGFCLRGMVARPLTVLTLQCNPLQDNCHAEKQCICGTVCQCLFGEMDVLLWVCQDKMYQWTKCISGSKCLNFRGKCMLCYCIAQKYPSSPVTK